MQSNTAATEKHLLFKRTLSVVVLCLTTVHAAVAQSSGSETRAASEPAARVLRHGLVGLGSWNTTVEFKDIVVTSNDVVLYQSNFEKDGTNGLTILSGKWSVTNGVLRQSAIDPQCRVFLGNKNWANYTLRLRARSTGGQEGFAVYFNALDASTWTWFNMAGWSNTLASIDRQQSGGPWIRMCDRVPSAIQTNVWYDVRVVLDGSDIQCYVNSKLVAKATYVNPWARNVAASGSTTSGTVASNNTASSTARSAAASNNITPRVASATTTEKENPPSTRFFNPTFHGAAGVGTWNTSAEFRNIVVTSNNVVLYRSDFDNEGVDSWQINTGNWVMTNGVLRQTEYDFGCFATIGDTNWSNYTLTLQARKISGAEGFCALVGAFGDNNRVWFNAGSWGNTSVEIYQDINGRRGAITERIPLTIETGKWYDIQVVVKGAQVSCYVNSNLIHTAIASVLVSTNARYLGSIPTSDGNLLRFKVGKREFRGKLAKDRGGPPALEAGSLVEVTGTVRPGFEVDAPDMAGDFDLEIYSPSDVVLLERPSWWTWQRTLWFGGISFVVLITAATWIAMISRKNRLLTITQRKLQEANDELERRVQDRTADLAKANLSLTEEVEERKRTAAQLEEKTLSLQNQIEERKRMQVEIERVHKQLVSASHQAGMAEVATSVLHNVGNVLNSINVSSSVVLDTLRKSRVANIGRIASLFQKNRANLAAFLTNDPKGAQLPDYLAELAQHLATEQAELLKEMETARKHIEHVKEIVKMQQNYAKVCGVAEKVKPVDLVEDALRLNANALTRHGIELVRDYPASELPEINIEKHKALQILVNLIANAKYACDEAGRKDKRMILEVRNGDDHLKFSVIDNGIGIPSENMTRIFNHGFTTRKDGHGFGLHSGALAAKELGGTLTAHSDGPGTGARFTLEVPFSPPKQEQS